MPGISADARGHSPLQAREARVNADKERALLVGVYPARNRGGRGAPQDFDGPESLDELDTLARSAGAEVVGRIVQRRASFDPATLVGAGKLEEIAREAEAREADVVIFDNNLTPTQLRNIEAALEVKVLDRTQLILDIFARRARTREGQLQV
ncbi:MAG TPA: GTPase HflX, partial [Bryobacterales bacterium]|nr:GTPase HflX [Bryobacterales bacterium]